MQDSPRPGALGDEQLAAMQRWCTSVRHDVLDEVEVTGSGHYGPAFSCVEILVSLHSDYLRVRPDEPRWGDRDRFVLSKGHACSALYPILADLGYFSREVLKTFTKLGSTLGDHPDMKKVPGVDFSSGALGHGLSIACGMAAAARVQGSKRRTVALLGDGELNEGQIWEAAWFAAGERLGSLLAIVDVNGVCVDGTTRDVLGGGSLEGKWEGFGWNVRRVDGHDIVALRDEFARYDDGRAERDARPTVLLADTVSGRGVDFIETMAEWHLGYLGGVDAERARTSIDAMYATPTSATNSQDLP